MLAVLCISALMASFQFVPLIRSRTSSRPELARTDPSCGRQQTNHGDVGWQAFSSDCARRYAESARCRVGWEQKIRCMLTVMIAQRSHHSPPASLRSGLCEVSSLDAVTPVIDRCDEPCLCDVTHLWALPTSRPDANVAWSRFSAAALALVVRLVYNHDSVQHHMTIKDSV